jgi:uncharacterized protein (DUF1499 family)
MLAEPKGGSERRSRAAVFAGVTGLLSVAATAFGPVSIQTGLLDSAPGFVVSLAGLGMGILLAMPFGAVGLRHTRPGSSVLGRRFAWVGLVSGGALLLLVLSLRPWSLWITLHDATTSIDDPPLFSDAVRERRAQRKAELGLGWVNTTDYPSGSPEHRPPISGSQVVEFQEQYYPDLAPIELPGVGPAQALALARGIAEELGWTITAVEPEAGVLEAIDVTAFFAFEDDIVVRVRPTGDGSVIDMRSTSRFRANDMRANAERIRSFARLLRHQGQ